MCLQPSFDDIENFVDVPYELLSAVGVGDCVDVLEWVLMHICIGFHDNLAADESTRIKSP